MPVRTYITDRLKDFAACVSAAGALLTSEQLAPPITESDKMILFRQNFSQKGDPSIIDMRVDGSVTPIEFEVKASPKNDLYIKTVDFLISDAGAEPKDFGAIPNGLTVCIQFFYENTDGTITIDNAIKTNANLIRICNRSNSFGDGVNAFLLPNVIATSDAYIPELDFAGKFGMPRGLKLKGGTGQRIVFKINDDITSIDAFDVIAYGFERLPD